MPNINKTLDVTVDLSPEELAEMFWSMNSAEQVEFFNHLGSVSNGNFAMQMNSVSNELDPELNQDGRYVMSIIGEYC